jgi:hypothetical protein
LYISILNFFCFAACVEINYTQPTNTRVFHFFSARRPRSCASGAQRPKDCPLKKNASKLHARAREKKRGGQPESGCGGAAEPPAASQDDALEPTLTALTARPPARPPARPKLFEKAGGWFAAEIETAKMTLTKRTLRDQEAACFLNRSSTEQTFLYLYLSLSLCFAFLFLKNSKSRRRDNTAPFPPRPKFKKNKRSRVSLVAL